MKKTYNTPEMFAVTLQHQTHLMEPSFHDVNGNGGSNTGIGYEGADDPADPNYGGGLAKGFTSDDLWNAEW